MSLPRFVEKLVEFFERLFGPPPEPEAEEAEPEIHGAAPFRRDRSSGQYAEIHRAVEQAIEHLVRQVVPEHRKYAKNDWLELHHVEVEPTNEASAELLDAFFHEFVPAARQEWIRDLIGTNAAIRTDYLAGLFRNEDQPVVDHLDAFQNILNHGAPCRFRVILWSRWVRGADLKEQAFTPTATTPGIAITLQIRDGQASRTVQRDRYPIKLGRRGDIVLTGTYVSGQHCTLQLLDGAISLEDHSKNGTWVNGVSLHRGNRLLSAGTYHLKLGQEHGDIKDAPEIDLEINTLADIAGATPVAGAEHTPIAGAAPSLWGMLHVIDATGQPRIDITNLPFTIGRSSGCDYVTPGSHAGVSGHHLRIESMDEFGAVVLNLAHNKNGTALDNVLQPQQFRWRFGEEITVAPNWKQAPPVRIKLIRAR